VGACTRRRPIEPLFVLRITTAVVVALVGFGAWKIAWIDLAEGVAMLTLVAIVHAVLVTRLRARTVVVPVP
jgi:hypothetical protein